ncbi:cysteine--tRNA ligase [Patescibacteria group bacterium]
MKIKLYNTLSKKLEEFKPIKPGEVGIYSCGPTVYWNQHIGHLYAYVQWDTLVRLFKSLGFKTTWVMNITDVGHLTSDGDTGQDKMEKGAEREGLSVWQIAKLYTLQFLESLQMLNIARPDYLPRATEHIEQQIELIKKIERKGFAYQTETGLVFDTSKFPGYAKFANLDLKKQQAGSRVKVDHQKKHPWDFLLWVTNQPKHVMQWESPWGKGFPGWHIECTAMSTKYLGERFDIHTGGREHISVHHSNEIAQAYGAFGCQTANYWLHNDWLNLKGEKMSKSKGKMYLVTDLVEKGYDPMHFRYLILTSHYRKGLNFSWEGLNSAKTAYEKLLEIVSGLQKNRGDNKIVTRESLGKTNNYREKFLQAMANDLKTPEAIAVIWEIVKSGMTAYDKYDLILDFDQVLGLKLSQSLDKKNEIEIPEKVELLGNKREALRIKEKWLEADQARKEIEKLGWQIVDTEAGPKFKPIV